MDKNSNISSIKKALLVSLDRIFFICLDNGLKFVQKHENIKLLPRIYKEDSAIVRKIHKESLSLQTDDKAYE